MTATCKIKSNRGDCIDTSSVRLLLFKFHTSKVQFFSLKTKFIQDILRIFLIAGDKILKIFSKWLFAKLWVAVWAIQHLVFLGKVYTCVFLKVYDQGNDLIVITMLVVFWFFTSINWVEKVTWSEKLTFTMLKWRTFIITIQLLIRL